MANIPISSFTAAANTTGIGMSGFSLTGSNAQSIIDLAGTWNTSGTPTGVKLNVTDTASNANSLLIDLQVGGVSKFKVAKNSTLAVETITANGSYYFTMNTAVHNSGYWASATAGALGTNGAGFALAANRDFAWTGTSDNPIVAVDLRLLRDAANTLAQRNGVNAQAFRAYNTYTDASNYERGVVAWIGNDLKIGTENAGTGSGARQTHIHGGGQLRLYTGNALRWLVDSSGHYVAGADNTYDIGASGATRPRYLYLGGGSLTGTQADSSLTISPTWNTTGTPTAMLLNVTDTASNAASLLMNLQVGGVSQFNVTKTGDAFLGATTSSFLYGQSTASYVRLGVNVGLANQSSGRNVFFNALGGVHVVGDKPFGWASGETSIANTMTLQLWSPTSDVFEQRRGVNAQTSRIYNTYTDASNYERGFMRWSSNILEIGNEAAGTGSNRATRITSPGGNLELRAGTAPWQVILTSAGHFQPSSNNNQDCGSAGGLWRNIFQAGYWQTSEMTAPAAPAANDVRIYAEDNGSGKTRLMARFATGAAVQIAIEP